jgi:hypothetical protein
MANDKYILSNDYYVEIETFGPESYAILYDPSGLKVNEGPRTIGAPLLILVKEIINDYTPTGRVNDTNSWINLPTVVREEVAPKPTKVEIKGRVIDSNTSEGLRGVKVTLDKFLTTTQPGGGFTLRITIEPGEKPPEGNIEFSLSKYEPKNTPALKLDGTLKNRINVIELNTIAKSLEKETANALIIDEDDINKMNSFNLKSAEAIITETINKEVNKINERLVPFALNLLAQFGITALNQLAKKSCPPLGGISKLINKKNKLTRQLNTILKIASKIQTVATILKALVLAFKVVRKLINVNPIPSTIGLPPGPAGGVIISTSLGKISTIEDKKDKLTKLVDKFGNVVGILTPTAIPIISALTKVLNLLSAIDSLIGECLDEARQAVIDELNNEDLDSNEWEPQFDYLFQDKVMYSGNQYSATESHTSNDNNSPINGGPWLLLEDKITLDNVDFETISDSKIRRILGISPNADFNVQDLLSGTYLQVQLDEELTNINKETAESGTPTTTEYNGFILGVETQEGKTNGDLKRRYAVGKDSQGVVVVKGEPSYASSDQILINELIFTIDKNDLKPN